MQSMLILKPSHHGQMLKTKPSCQFALQQRMITA